MNSLPTIAECNHWILEQCQTILYYIEKGNLDINDMIQSTVESAKMLINALDITSTDKSNLLNRLERYSKFNSNDTMMKLLILNIKEICFQVTDEQLHKEHQDLYNFFREEERILTNSQDTLNWPDQIDEKAYWFRKYFVGKPYITLIGPFLENNNDFAIFSIVKEVVTKNHSQFRIIVRTKQDAIMGFIVDEKDTNELILKLECLNQIHLLDTESEKRHRPLRSLSSAIITGIHHHVQDSPSKWMRASLLFLFQEINFKLFKEFSAETTIMLGLEKEFLKYDEIGIPKSYKFGVLTVQDGQDTEEEWFSNSQLSTELVRFLNIIGRPVKLKDFHGYAAGLDTKTGESGELSYVSSWKDHEIMFHVAPLMPTRENDSQQVHRKRHIGNDIVCIVFIEGRNQKFNPNAIKSQFLHVFIVVYFDIIDSQDTWRIEVLYDKGVKPFSPPIPSPPIFYNEKELERFLILKLVNAENASLKSGKFSLPNNKARLSILKNLIETGLDANTTTRGCLGEKTVGNERPKSAGAQQMSIRNRHVVIESCRSLTPELPPVPSISRSNVLRDFKNLTRRKSSGQQYYTKQHCVNSTLSTSKTQHFDDLRSCHIISEEEKSPNESSLIETNTLSTFVHSGNGIRHKAQYLISSVIDKKKKSTNKIFNFI